MEIESAKASVRGYFSRSGTILERTEQHRAAGVEVDLDIRSRARRESIEELAWLAEEMCFVIQAIKNPVEAKLNLTLNGQALE